MPDDMNNMNRILGLLAQAEKELASGKAIDDVCAALLISEDELKMWSDQYVTPPNAVDSLDNSRLLDAVFPVFCMKDKNSPLEQIGSGVVVEIGDDLFMLTAAHVTDHGEDGLLYMPVQDGIESISGGFSHNPVPSDSSRSEDNADMAYYHLTSEWRQKLHPSIKPVGVGDLLLTDDMETGNLFTYVGYPWRKTKHKADSFETDRTTYSGHALPRDVYKSLNYNRAVHVVIRMRLKKTYSSRYQSHQAAPHPHGISGGAVLSWPRTLHERLGYPELKLAGIGHTYHSSHHCLAATRVIPYMLAIVRNNPHLAKYFVNKNGATDIGEFFAAKMASLNPDNIPSAVGISWYKPENYQQCLEMFDDSNDLPGSYDEWLLLAEKTEKQLSDQRINVIRANIDPDTFLKWCGDRGYSIIDKDARIEYCNTIVGQEFL